MKIRHRPSDTELWRPFDIIILFTEEQETEEIYEILKDNSNPQIRKLGEYIESASNSGGELLNPETV